MLVGQHLETPGDELGRLLREPCVRLVVAQPKPVHCMRDPGIVLQVRGVRQGFVWLVREKLLEHHALVLSCHEADGSDEVQCHPGFVISPSEPIKVHSPQDDLGKTRRLPSEVLIILIGNWWSFP